MNIAQAKEQIKNTVKAYEAKDESGLYRIEPNEQRPVLLMGPPGIGKTAIARQAAQELGIGFLSYSMTHHTRQSALGLPVILNKEFQGKEYQISEYTMSEIIASVYEQMEETGIEEGILFLDEINCVSETLTPVMLQFLQYKVFGKHQLPDGWVVVAAGNPPEYNRSARNFDIVTLDRLKVIEIEPDYEAWRVYASGRDTHPAVMSFLASHKNRFYDVSVSASGRTFATARGWSDLAEMITVCETEGLPVNKDLISQYIRHPEAAAEFSAFYDLYMKYQRDYHPELILAGSESEQIRTMAKEASFDERWSVLSMLVRLIRNDIGETLMEEDKCLAVRDVLRNIKDEKDYSSALDEKAQKIHEKCSRDRLRGLISKCDEKLNAMILDSLQQFKGIGHDFEEIRRIYQSDTAKMKQKVQETSAELDHLFAFVKDVWTEEEELLLVTELSASKDCARFIGEHGCDAYFESADMLHFDEKRSRIKQEIEELKTEI